MAFTSKKYGLATNQAYTGGINWPTGAIKVMLTTSAYTPNQDTDVFKSAVTNEITGTGYTAGGVTLTGKTMLYTAGTNTIAFDAADAQWMGATFTFRTYVIYLDTGTPGTSPLIAYGSETADVTVTGGTLTLVWDSNGIFAVTAA